MALEPLWPAQEARNPIKTSSKPQALYKNLLHLCGLQISHKYLKKINPVSFFAFKWRWSHKGLPRWPEISGREMRRTGIINSRPEWIQNLAFWPKHVWLTRIHFGTYIKDPFCDTSSTKNEIQTFVKLVHVHLTKRYLTSSAGMGHHYHVWLSVFDVCLGNA